MSNGKWENLDFLKGLKGHINKEIEKKYCCKPSKLLNKYKMKNNLEETKEYPLLGKDDVCRLMELSYDMGKKGERYSLWELYLLYINQNNLFTGNLGK